MITTAPAKGQYSPLSNGSAGNPALAPREASTETYKAFSLNSKSQRNFFSEQIVHSQPLLWANGVQQASAIGSRTAHSIEIYIALGNHKVFSLDIPRGKPVKAVSRVLKIMTRMSRIMNRRYNEGKNPINVQVLTDALTLQRVTYQHLDMWKPIYRDFQELHEHYEDPTLRY